MFKFVLDGKLRVVWKNFSELDIQEILLSSINDFKFKINKNFRISNLEIKSEIDIHNLELKTYLQLKKIFIL